MLKSTRLKFVSGISIHANEYSFVSGQSKELLAEFSTHSLRTPTWLKNWIMLAQRLGFNMRRTVAVRARAITTASLGGGDSPKCSCSKSSDILSKYACSAACCWLSEAIPCSFLLMLKANK